MTSVLLIEITLRGMAAGVNLLMAGVLLFSNMPRAQRLAGAIFLLSTCFYIITSADESVEIVGFLIHYLKYFAIFNSTFFWWFALSLFDDEDFRLGPITLTPLIILALMHTTAPFWPMQNTGLAVTVLHGAVNIMLMGHTIWLALHDRHDDLVDPRRKFRLVFALTVGVMAVMTALIENIDAVADLPTSFTFIHAIILLGLTFFFNVWFLAPNSDLFLTPPKNRSAQSSLPHDMQAALSAANQPVLERLTALMNEGAYREEGLTVAALAEKVGVPEHQLRRLINQDLGYRNFSAFLNVRRIEAAKAALGEPERARERIIQIAHELGYGSLAPFNRAFKEATGKTPTEFRRDALGAKQNNGLATDRS
ncbi:MAG: AraC family transcriptional regulator [Pseudomonadota bacterium]